MNPPLKSLSEQKIIDRMRELVRTTKFIEPVHSNDKSQYVFKRSLSKRRAFIKFLNDRWWN